MEGSPFPSFNYQIPKKILIAIALLVAYLLTIKLSLYVTPPYPRLDLFLSSVKKIITPQPKTNPIKIDFTNLLSLFVLPKTINSISSGSSTRPTVDNQLFQQITPPTRFPTRPTNLSPTSLNNNLYQLPTAKPTPTLMSSSPTTIKPTASNTLSPPSTPTPKPTKPPKPSPTPRFILTNPRPGKNIQEVAEIVNPIFCVPAPMLLAIYDHEAGYLKNKVTSNWVYYNTYHGSDPTDIAGSTAVFGVTQMMGDTWHKIKPYVGQKLGSTELSLEVTFDAMAAAAYHLGNISLAWSNKINCDDWPAEYILYGACRYNGACPPNTFGQKQYYNSYTFSVCQSYNQYSGKQKKCQ